LKKELIKKDKNNMGNTVLSIELTHPTTLGRVNLPSSKSITNRLLMMNALCDKKASILNKSTANDSVVMEHILSGNEDIVNVEDAGTVARFLTAYFSAGDFHKKLICSDRMKERPMKQLLDALRQLGAEIRCTEKEGHLPAEIKGKQLEGGKISISGSISSQFLSALILIAPTFKKPLELEITGDLVSAPYLYMTLSLMESFGIHTNSEEFIQGESNSIIISPGKYELPEEIMVESDWTSASYWYAAAALSDRSEIELKGLFEQSLQGDAILPFLFDTFGIATNYTRDGIMISKVSEPEIEDFDFDFTDNPDLALTMAVVCCGLKIPATLTGLKTLADKESNRIQVIADELGKMGADVKITDEDSLEIDPNHFSFHPDSIVETHNDHRIALAFAPLALKFGRIKIQNPDVVKKSYRNYWDDITEVYKTSKVSILE
jgi:3-phosphoshikimate 1-carboxyvinyltransferase